MDLDEPLFRPEAIQYQQSFRGPGELLETSTRRNEGLFLLLLILLALGIIVALLIRLDGESVLSVLVPPLREYSLRPDANRVPFVQALELAECGAASLAMTLAFHGKQPCARQVVQHDESERAAEDGQQALVTAGHHS